MKHNIHPALQPYVYARSPLFNRDAPLSSVPREWLEHIEPYMVRWRNFAVKGDCWFWTGAMDNGGEPVRSTLKVVDREVADVTKHSNKKEAKERVKLFVMRIFFNIDRVAKPSVVHVCGNKSCLNPHHLLLCQHEYYFRGHAERDYRDCTGASPLPISASDRDRDDVIC